MCQLCNANPVYEFTNQRKLCKNCFFKWVHKKVFYTIRKFEMIKPSELVGYFPKDDFRSVVLEDILKMLAENGRIKIVKLSSRSNQIKLSKLAVQATTDLIAYEIVEEIIEGNLTKLKNISSVQKAIKPLCLFLDKEILLYAKLKKLKFKQEKGKKNKIQKFIDELEHKHPEIKQAIIKGILKI